MTGFAVQRHEIVQARVNRAGTQAKDHPILPAAIETQYLKCGIFRVDK